MSGTVSAPAARLLIGGAAPAGTRLMDCRIAQSRYGRGDTFEARCAVQPDAARWWDPAGTGNTIDASIQIAVMSGPLAIPAWTTMFRGLVDGIDWDAVGGEVHITGRDYLGRLRDLAVQQDWLNHTGSEILVLLIQAAGLTADVQLAGDGMSGAFYTTQHKRSAGAGKHRFSSAFDLARYIVDGANCDLWADGMVVRVRPRPTGAASRTITYVPPPPGGGSATMPVWGLGLRRDMLIDRGVIVKVSSWDSRQRQTHAYYWSKSGGSRTSPASANADVYAYTPPGLSDGEVQQRAAQFYAETIAHTREVSFTMQGDLVLMPRMRVALAGTGSSWDGTLDVDEVTRSLSVDTGFEQSVVLRTRVTPANVDDEESD